MKIRLANKIFDSCGTEMECNSYKMDKAKTVILRHFKNYKTPKWVLRKRELKYKDKIIASNNIISEELREYINNKQLKRKRHEKRK